MSNRWIFAALIFASVSQAETDKREVLVEAPGKIIYSNGEIEYATPEIQEMYESRRFGPESIAAFEHVRRFSESLRGKPPGDDEVVTVAPGKILYASGRIEYASPEFQEMYESRRFGPESIAAFDKIAEYSRALRSDCVVDVAKQQP